MQVIIYCLIDPITLKIRYIGRTSKKILNHRLIEHISKSVNKNKYSNSSKNHKENWVCLLHSKGLKPIIRKLTTVQGWDESYIIEQKLIEKYRDRLLNHKDKGKGSISPISIEQRNKISNTLKKRFKFNEIKKSRVKTFYVYDNLGNFLFERCSIKNSAIELGISEDTISKHLNGKAKIETKYKFSFLKLEKLKIDLKCFHIYLYDKNNNELFFNNYKEAANFLNISYKKFSSSVQKKRCGEYIVSKTKILNFNYIPYKTSFIYYLSNNLEKFSFFTIKEVASFLNIKNKNPYLSKLKYRAIKMNYNLEKCPFKK